MIKMDQYTFLTEAEINELIESAGAVGFIIGILIGLVIFVFFVYFIDIQGRRNFKMWFLQLPEKEKIKAKEHLEALSEHLDELAKYNTRLFKKSFNTLCELKTYLQKKWMQN